MFKWKNPKEKWKALQDTKSKYLMFVGKLELLECLNIYGHLIEAKSTKGEMIKIKLT